MNLAPYISALMLGLAGSLHCIGMCGPIAAAIPGRASRHAPPVLIKLYYNGGRVLTYSLLGLLAGGLGEAFRRSHLPRTFSIACGVLLLLGWFGKKWLTKLSLTRRVSSRVQKATLVFLREPQPEAMWVAGMLNGLLPYGLAHTAMAASTLMPSAPGSAVYMLLFGLGTTPAMYAVSSAGGLMRRPGRFHWNRATPVLTVLAGLFLILRGLSLGIPILSPAWDAAPGTAGACCSAHAVEESNP